MAQMYCHNCEQNVNAEKEVNSSGCIFVVLLVLGLILLPFGIWPGAIVLSLAVIVFVVVLFTAASY